MSSPDFPARPGPAPAPSAPDQAARRLWDHLQPSRSDATFLKVAVASWLGLSALLATSAVLLDPLGHFMTGLVQPATTPDRDQKAAAYLRLVPKPELLVLGSSRLQTVSPPCLEALTGQRAFNFSLTAGGLADDWAVFRFVREHEGASVKRILIGVDPELFKDMGPPEQLKRSFFLRKYGPEVPRLRWSRLGGYLLGADVAEASLRSVRHLLGLTRRPVRFGDDGFADFARQEEELRQPGAFEAAFQVTLASFRNMYGDFRALNERRVAQFRKLLSEAHRRGIEVDAFIPPVHPRLVRTLADEKLFYDARAADTAALLERLQREGLLRHHPVGSIEAFGGDPARFLDGGHMTAANMNRLLMKVFGRESGCAVQ